jgi:hypothetical protein
MMEHANTEDIRIKEPGRTLCAGTIFPQFSRITNQTW